MFRFLYYKSYIEILDTHMLLELKQDIEKDYVNEVIEPHQYEYLSKKIKEKLNKEKVACI